MFHKFMLGLALGIGVLLGFFIHIQPAKTPTVEPPVVIDRVAEQVKSGQETPIGASIPVAPALFETSLQGKIAAAATSMTLISGTDGNGNSLSGFMCFTLDEGNTSSVEFVCGTASSTSVTGLTRGINRLTGTSTVASLAKSHNRGATVKVTNYPSLTILSRVLNGDETVPNPLKYETTVSTSTLSGNTAYLASVGYVNGVALQGAPTATTTIPGVVQIGTAAQLSAGTGMTGAYTLVPAGSLFNAVPQSATTVPVTQASGKLAQGFFDLTSGWTFSGAVVHSATTTLAATSTAPLILRGITYAFPSANATGTLNNAGNGVLTWGTNVGSYASTTVTDTFVAANANHDFVYTTSFTPKIITIPYHIKAFDNSGVATYCVGIATFDGTTVKSNYRLANNAASGNLTITGVTMAAATPNCGTGAANGVGIDISVVNVSSTGFTVRLNYVWTSGVITPVTTFGVSATQ